MIQPGDRPDSVTLGEDVMVTRWDVLSWCDPVEPAVILQALWAYCRERSPFSSWE